MFWFKQIEHTADLGLEVSGESLEELFLAAWKGWKMLVQPDGYERFHGNTVMRLDAEEPEFLLVDFLSEINYLFFARNLLVDRINYLSVSLTRERFVLKANCEMFEPSERGDYANEIKAVTYHQLKVYKKNGFYRTKIFFDV